MTLLSFWLLYTIIPPIIDWAIINSVWTAGSRKECWDQMPTPGAGACWAFIENRIGLFTYGFYPEPLRWRVNLSFVLFVLAAIPVLTDKLPFRKYGLMYSAAFPFLVGWLLVGGWGLEPVDTDQFGGIMLTLVIGVTGITFSLPIGIALALGRQSKMPVLRMLCVLFIEFIRGVPLITLLFVASTMLNYFLPPGTVFDLLLRVLIMVTLFASAYMAEIVRGGLQAIEKGQHEAGDSLGLSYWQAQRLIVLPQALKIAIPNIVNAFIGLYKDTTLVLIIGLLDILGLGDSSLADLDWAGLANELYLFVALFFFTCCFSMSRYSLYLEKKLHTGH
ncbi:MAG: amino acid ABC transporter permease [SAR324 cluster bacterium]|nr:amino acid ABC transporter permease [SAR324 cluster bacterium]MBL7035989.1 amino acid ABC transporter permease [SAR324 cluster bacterium]